MAELDGQLDALALLDEVLFEPYTLTVTWLPNGQPMYFGTCAGCSWAANIAPAPAGEGARGHAGPLPRVRRPAMAQAMARQMGDGVNDAFSAAERRHLAEPERDFCDVLGCTNEAEPESILCARHEDDLHDYRSEP